MNNIENYDLYNILELNKDATLLDIKKNFKRLALLYHPDKNINNNYYNEKFNQIKIAYEILSNKIKKDKYDNLINSKKNHFCKIILLFIKKITNIHLLNNLIKNKNIKNDIKNGKLKSFYKKILNDIDNEIDISKINNLIDINITDNTDYTDNTDNTNNTNDNNTDNTNTCTLTKSSSYNSEGINTLNINASIDVNLYDVYNNKINEIIVNKKIYKNNNIYYEHNKYYIPLYNKEIILSKSGHQITDNDINIIGDVLISINYINDNNIIKENNNLIYYDNISLNELFNGFNKNLKIYDNLINIKSLNPFKDYNFDGDYMTIVVNNKGFIIDDNTKGDLIIKLNFIKTDLFNKYINLL